METRNYLDNSIAQNKKKQEIVYRFADGTKAVITEDDYNAYIAEHPLVSRGDETLQSPDFETLKAVSNDIYEQEDDGWNAQTKKNLSFDIMGGSEYRYEAYELSPETLFFVTLDAPEEARKLREREAIVDRTLDRLTEIQRRRYLMYAVDGLTVRKIAKKEGVIYSNVHKSLAQAKKKIKEFVSNS